MSKNRLEKITILSLIAVSLTACGGGGGGGAPSSGGEIVQPPVEDSEIIIEANKSFTNSETINVKNKKIGILGKSGSEIYNNGKINVFSNLEEKIAMVSYSGRIQNNSEINLSGENSIGIYVERGTGTNSIYGKIIGENSGNIIGLKAINGEIGNLGKIYLNNNNRSIGLYGENSTLRNSGEIRIGGLGTGIISKNGTVYNSGEIVISGNGIGINADNTEVSNSGTIEITSESSSSIGIYGSNKAKVYNNGEININENGIGIKVTSSATAINNGTININGQGYGIYAKGGSYALNEGVINLSSQANGGMIADGNGSIVENKGTINVDTNSSLTKDKVVTAINGGKVLNSGNIIFKDKATIYSVDGLYTIGTSQDGSYGKVVAENIEIDGNVAIDSGISKGSYKDTYILEGVFEGEVEFGDEYKVVSDSLLYDVNIVQGGNGNYDGKLVRNDKVISDFTGKNYTQTAKLFDKYFSENEYNSLNEAGKNLIDSINIEDENILKKNIKDLTPTLYANNSRIISEIGDSFKEQREKTILSLEEYDYNFSFIGNIMAVDSEEIIEGYDSQMTGFVGTMKLSDEKYLSLGYGYSDIDYDGDSEGNIHSIHLGVDNYKKYGALNLQYGVGGEYNFHKIDREMRSYNTKGESDFDSYGVKAYGKILKSYKSVVEIEPFISLGLGYYHVDNISEKSNVTINVAEEDYLSIKPELGFDIAKKYDTIKLYGGVAYSYELGDMDKRVAYSYEGIVENNEIKDNQENGLLTTKIGVNFIKNSFTFGVEGGKNFGKRDNSFISGNIGYRF